VGFTREKTQNKTYIKKLLIPFLALTLFSMNSCIKGYTCTCTANGKDYVNNIAPTAKSSAQNTCDIWKSLTEDNNPGAVVTCELK